MFKYLILLYFFIILTIQIQQGVKNINIDQSLVKRNLNTCQQNKFQVKTKVYMLGESFCEFNINDQLKFKKQITLASGQKGIYIAYLNQNQSELETVELFDTSVDITFYSVQLMINFIESIPKDRWIFVGLVYDGFIKMNQQGFDALGSIGFRLQHNPLSNQAIALIGHKNYRELGSLIVSKHDKTHMDGSLADTGQVCMELTQCSSSNKTILDYCQCNIGKYQIDQLDQNEDCNGFCDLKCEVCKSNSTNCLSCSIELRDINTNCDCKATQYYDPDTCLPISDEYYQDPLQNYEIFSCEYPCKRCETKIKCFSCQNPLNQQDQNICINCSNRYFSNTFECKYCQVKCLECIDDISVECIECSHYTRNIDNNCECTVGFYEQIPPNEECLKCKPECISCNIDECTECKASLNYENQTCLPISNKYYQDPLQNYEIFNCVYPCNECRSKTDCISCQTPQNRVNNFTCGCQEGYFENQSYCEKCQPKCKSCTISNSNCQECFDDTRDLQNNCNCIQRHSELQLNDQSCTLCEKQCLTCEINIYDCLECIDDTRENPPLCKCKDKTYEDEDKICQDCMVRCKTCSTKNECNECTSLNYTNDDCTCIDGYYFDILSLQCLKCKYPCQKCVDHENNCLSCIGDQRQSNCQCIEGYYDSIRQQTCLKCAPQCQTCINYDECTSCQQGVLRLMKVPECGCQPQTFPIKNSLICQQCSPQCKSCISIFYCLECLGEKTRPPLCLQQQLRQNNFHLVEQALEPVDQLINSMICAIQCKNCQYISTNCVECKGLNRKRTPNCNCIPGYYDNLGRDDDCSPCMENCAVCDNSYTCSVCTIGLNRQFNPFTQQCECKYGFTSRRGEAVCKMCYFYQDQCFLKCPESTRQIEGEVRECVNVTYHVQSHQKLIYFLGFSVVLLYLMIFLMFKYFPVDYFYTLYEYVKVKSNFERQQQLRKGYNNLNNSQSSNSKYDKEIQNSVLDDSQIKNNNQNNENIQITQQIQQCNQQSQQKIFNIKKQNRKQKINNNFENKLVIQEQNQEDEDN